ncbi:MAG: aminodeoxychorismate synthase component I [Crocinitomix sp.]|nr:aminodeoxychorismate synthase component I [Crocinitomix sp.]
MKKYSTINSNLDWRKLLPLVQNENVVLLNQPNGDFLLAWGDSDKINIAPNQYDAKLVQEFLDAHLQEYIFGYLAYDIKNDETRSTSNAVKGDKGNDVFLLAPEHVLIKTSHSNLYFGKASNKTINQFINNTSPIDHNQLESITLKPQTNKDDYLKDIIDIKNQIQKGIIYEMNYCVKFENKFTHFNPVQTYSKLVDNAEAPFSAFVHDGNNYVLSASPERFLNKTGPKLKSQPIKGTAKRGTTNQSDVEIKMNLALDPKEISENVMIVDLVRNDLAKIATKKSVTVEELCEPYTFKTVHQLISTISCDLRPNISFTEILQALFPMGSMTGAPKISAISNINQFESFRRGVYSGAIGYISPNGNFDFNVVIRSIFADMLNKNISCGVGGAITINSHPVKEYEECLLKLNVIQNTLC